MGGKPEIFSFGGKIKLNSPSFSFAPSPFQTTQCTQSLSQSGVALGINHVGALKKGKKNHIWDNKHPALTPPSKVRAFPCLFTLLDIIFSAWAHTTRLKVIVFLKKEVCADILGPSLPLPPCIPEGKVKGQSRFLRNWARGAQRVNAFCKMRAIPIAPPAPCLHK